jgi:hypothetical protein
MLVQVARDCSVCVLNINDRHAELLDRKQTTEPVLLATAAKLHKIPCKSVLTEPDLTSTLSTALFAFSPSPTTLRVWDVTSPERKYGHEGALQLNSICY